MTRITVVPIGAVPPKLLGAVVDRVGRTFGTRVQVRHHPIDPAPTFHPERQQYHSTELLHLLLGCADPSDGTVIGLTPVDLYIPILKYLFGEAQHGGSGAVVGFHRLREEFYGLPGNTELLAERTVKEVLHELGHTYELTHCDDYECLMASAHSVERVDLKTSRFCAACTAALGSNLVRAPW
ncbi:MAG TPA: archaemetzincin family Zn-dependent metalloprotease [Thermoanaerobaculia bacterium]